jgi:hypothetical protein
VGLQTIPVWSSRALQGLAYWIGYQHSFGVADRLSEGAIATEFMRLMIVHREVGRTLETEVMYRHIPEISENPLFVSSRMRADLIVSRGGRKRRDHPFAPGAVEAVVEVKHSRSQHSKVLDDIDLLGDLRRFSGAAIRGFLLYAAVNKRPRFTDILGAGNGTIVESTPKGTRYKVRRVCRATQRVPFRNQSAIGHYVVLIEVV